MTNRPLQHYKIIIITVKLQHVPHNSVGKFTNIYTFRALILSHTTKYKISQLTTPSPTGHMCQDAYNHGIYATCTSPIMHLFCPQILHCFQFLLGRLWYPGEIKNKGYAKFWGANKVHYGRCTLSGVWSKRHEFIINLFFPVWIKTYHIASSWGNKMDKFDRGNY